MPNHDTVAHNWAHQTKARQKGYALYFEGAVVYSWGAHFPIAAHVKDKSGESVILYTTAGYSKSTGKHKTIVRRAIPRGWPVFDVPDVLAESRTAHRRNYAEMLRRREIVLAKASRARSNKPLWIDAAEGIRDAANRYTRAFRLGFRLIERPVEIDALLAAHAVNQREAEARRIKRDREIIRAWLAAKTDRAPHTRTPYVRVQGDIVQTSWGVSVPLRKGIALFRLARQCLEKGRGFMPSKIHRIGVYQLEHISRAGAIRVGCHTIPFEAQRLAARVIGLA